MSSSPIVESGREDLNLRPPQPHCGALPGCATPRYQEQKQYSRKATSKSRATPSLSIIIQNAPTIATRLQFSADTHSLHLAGSQNHSAPLTRILLNFRDGASLFSTLQGFIALK